MKRFFLTCLLAFAAVPAYADTVMAIASSDATEWIGQGQAKTYTNANATFTVTGDRTRATVRVVGADGKTWDLRLKAPVGRQLTPREYWFAERESSETGRAPGMEFSGNGRACGDVYGDFRIRQIGFDANGKINLLEASVLQRCDSDQAAPLAIVVMYRAPRLSFALDSKPTDYIGQGLKYTQYGDTSLFSLTGGTGGFTFRVEGLGVEWTLLFATPYNEQFYRKGTFLTYETATGLIGGMNMFGNGRGGGARYGKLEILSVTYNAQGDITQLSARFWFYQDEYRTQLVRSGGINYWK